MGQVFAGTDQDGREYACKVLRPELTADPAAVARFLQERNILVMLRHPNLVGVHDLVAEGGTVGIVMDLVTGPDLRQVLTTGGPLLPAEVARIGAGLAAALAVVHAAGVVHRDVKPENVLLDPAGSPPTPRLTDFGISRLATEADQGRSTLLVGTPQYVAPELVDGAEPTPAADLYSLGILLYELCCGVTPFAGGSMLTVLRRHAEATPGRPDGIPDPLWDLLAWLLAKTPAGRPQSAQKVATLLDALAVDLRGVPVAPRLTEPPAPLPGVHGQETVGPLPAGGAPGRHPGGAAQPAARTRRGRLIVAAAVLIALVGSGVAVAAARGGGSPRTAAASASTTPGQPAGGPTPAQLPATTAEPPTTATTTAAAPTGPAPNLVGKALADAPGLLPSSVELVPTDTVDPKAGDGTILAQDPAAGRPLTTTMRVTVARQPAIAYLADLTPTTGQWTYDSPAQLSGTTYPHSVGSWFNTCNRGQSESVEYNLSRGYRKLVTTAGLDDNAEAAAGIVRLEVFADGRPVSATTLRLGRPSPITVDVTNVLRLKVEWQVIAGPDCGRDAVVLGEAELLGLPSEVPQPTDGPTDQPTDQATDAPTGVPTP